MQNKFNFLLDALTIMAALMLCGCGTTNEVDSVTPTPTLNVNQQKPLTLAPVHFTVKVDAGQPQFILTTKDYANLSIDLEQAQNYLDVQKKQLDDSKHYYDNLNK